jgi:hypothetical protein
MSPSTYLRVVTIRSHALTVALAGAVALVPAAAVVTPALARSRPPKPVRVPFEQPKPKNRAAARHIDLERQAIDIINAATRHVRGTVSGCAIRSAFDGRRGITHDAPSQDFLNAIAALRRPGTPDELNATNGEPAALLPGETYVDYRRDVTTAGGRTLTIVMGRSVRPAYVEPQKCLDAEHAEILRHLRGKPHALRSVTLQEYGHLRAGVEQANAQPRTPTDGVYLFHDGGGGGGVDFAYFKQHGVFGSSGGGADSATVDGLVPDGVATVKLIYPKVVSRGRYYKPKVFPSAITLTLPVKDNVVSAQVARSAPDALANRMIWLDAAGNVLNDVTQP